MSLQVCYCCGWSKVTTYQGLRIHQGRMGCTPTGVKIEEPEQKYLWGSVDVQMDLKLDVHTFIKTETKNYYRYSDLSLQVCHCGWTKMTTYQGLRTHQGKKGCTPKRAEVLKTERHLWRDHQKKDQGKRPLTGQENLPEPPRMGRSINCAAAEATIKEEFKSPVPRRSSVQSKPEFSTLPLVSRSVRGPSTAQNPDVVRAKKKKMKSLTVTQNNDKRGIEDYLKNCGRNKYTTAAAARIKEEPSSPFTTLEVSAKNRSQQSINKLVEFSSDLQEQRAKTPAVPPKQRDSRDRAPSRMNSLVREHPQISHPEEPVVQQKEKHWEDPQVNGSVREQLPAPPAVPPQKNSLRSTEGREGHETQLLREIQNCSAERNLNRGEKLGDIRPAGPTCENVSGSPRRTGENKSPFTARRDSLKKATKSVPSAVDQMNGSVSKRRTTPPPLPPKKKDSPSFAVKSEKPEAVQETAVQPKDEDSGGETLKQSSSPSVRSPAPVVEQKQSPSVKDSTNTEAAEQVNRSVGKSPAARPAVPPKKKNLPSFTTEPKKAESGLEQERPNKTTREEEIGVVKPGETESEGSVGQTETTEISPEPDAVQPDAVQPDAFQPDAFQPDAVQPDAVQPDAFQPDAVQPDVSTGIKVKDLARMFSAPTAQEKTSRPKEKLGGENRLSQVKIFAQRFSAIKTQETTGGLKKKNKEEQKPTQVKELARMFSVQQAAARLKEEPGHGEKPRLSQVKNLAQRFLPSTVQETAAELKEADREEQKLTQRLAGSTSAATKANTAALKAPTEEEQKSSYEATQLSGLKVRDLARMFSANGRQEKSA